MKKKYLTIALLAGAAFLVMTAGIYAGTQAADEIKLENKAYANHKEAVIVFQHKKHQTEYQEKNPGLFKSQCGECHHQKESDTTNKPLVNLKEGDEVKNCIECHQKADYVKGEKAKGLSDVQKRAYHANAMHDNCKSCHKEHNQQKGLKPKEKGYAPVTCKSCHSKG